MWVLATFLKDLKFEFCKAPYIKKCVVYLVVDFVSPSSPAFISLHHHEWARKLNGHRDWTSIKFI